MTGRPIRGLRGERVYLRPLEPDDAELVHRWYEDARIQTLMGDPPLSLARRRQPVQRPGTGRALGFEFDCRLADCRSGPSGLWTGRALGFEFDCRLADCRSGPNGLGTGRAPGFGLDLPTGRHE